MRAALIPMKDFAGAKMRLEGALDADARSELARAMLVDVVRACVESGRFEQTHVVSNDSEVHWQAREAGAKALAEPATLRGLNDSITFGARYLARRVAAREIVIFPGDLPLIRADDVRAVIDALGGDAPRIVIVRARDGGTNALALRPPEGIAMHYGAQSADAHLAAARAAGIEAVELESERIAFDVDSAEDLAALASLPLAPATAGWLDAHAHYTKERG